MHNILILILLSFIIFIPKKNDDVFFIKKTLLISYPKKIKDSNGNKIISGLTDFQAEVYANIFHSLSIKYSIDWEILAALIYVESQFDGTLKSKSNCKGVLQMSESTAFIEANIMNIPFIKNHSLWNDLDCIELGLHHFIRSIDSPGTYDVAIKRYVGGYRYNDSNKYVQWYYNEVIQEFYRLKLLFKGARNDKG